MTSVAVLQVPHRRNQKEKKRKTCVGLRAFLSSQDGGRTETHSLKAIVFWRSEKNPVMALVE
jgi:hypothetical protein